METFFVYDSTSKGKLLLGFKENFNYSDFSVKLKGLLNTDSGRFEGRANLFSKVKLGNFPKSNDETVLTPGILYDFKTEDAVVRLSGKKKVFLDTKKTWFKAKAFGEWALGTDLNKDYRAEGRMEFSHLWFDFNDKQDLKLKAGVRWTRERQEPVGYLVVRENNWRVEVDSDKKMMVRYDL